MREQRARSRTVDLALGAGTQPARLAVAAGRGAAARRSVCGWRSISCWPPAVAGSSTMATFTGTADEVFASGRANCLGFTLLFVGMARQLGVDAGFFRVDQPAELSPRGRPDLCLRARHRRLRGRRRRAPGRVHPGAGRGLPTGCRDPRSDRDGAVLLQPRRRGAARWRSRRGRALARGGGAPGRRRGARLDQPGRGAPPAGRAGRGRGGLPAGHRARLGPSGRLHQPGGVLRLRGEKTRRARSSACWTAATTGTPTPISCSATPASRMGGSRTPGGTIGGRSAWGGATPSRGPRWACGRSPLATRAMRVAGCAGRAGSIGSRNAPCDSSRD